MNSNYLPLWKTIFNKKTQIPVLSDRQSQWPKTSFSGVFHEQMQGKQAGSRHCGVLTGTGNSSSNKTIPLPLAMVDLAGAGRFAVPWPGSSLGGGKQRKHSPSRTPWLGEGWDPWGLPGAQLSSSVLLVCSPGGAPAATPAVLGASWLCMTPLPRTVSSLGSCLGVLEMLKLVEIFSLSTYVVWFECAHWAVGSCCWNGAWQREWVTNQKTLPGARFMFSFHLQFELGQIWKVLTIFASCEEMECNKNNPALAALLCELSYWFYKSGLR